jgi:hypothetical protein
MMSTTRRNFISQLGFGLLASSSLLLKNPQAQAACQRVSGVGSSSLGPFDPVNWVDSPVYLLSDLGFDETLVFCKVTTNFDAFKFPTVRMGVIEFAAHEFSMDMRSVSIDSMVVNQGSNGPEVNYTGILRSETRVFSGERMKVFVEDHASFGCTAAMAQETEGARVSGNYFSMTARFDPTKEQAAIFGVQATFAGQLTEGHIVIIP